MRGTKKGLASLILALALLASPSAFAKEKKQSLLESARQTLGEVVNGAAVVQGVGNMLGGGNEPKTVPTPDGGSMPNPRTMNIVIGRAVDLRDTRSQIQRWRDPWSGTVYEIEHVYSSKLADRVTSDFHVEFSQEGSWNVIGQVTSREAADLVADYSRDHSIDQRTLVALKKRFAGQTLIITEITQASVQKAVQGGTGKFNLNLRESVLKVNVFMIDVETGITRPAVRVEGKDQQIAVGQFGDAEAFYLISKASVQAARKAAKVLARIDRGPVRWRDADPLERIRDEVLNGTKFKAYKDGLLGDLVEVGKRTWTLKFDDVTEIVKGDEFEIYSATKLGRKDEPTGVFVKVENIDKKERLVDTYVSKIDPQTSGILPQVAPSGQGSGQPNVRPSAQKPVEPQATVAEKFSQARPGSVLPFEGKEPGEEFCGFYAQVADCMPAKGAKTTTWLERGKVVMIVNPAKDSKDQPVKGLVGDMKNSGEWVVWVLGGPPTADAVGKKVAWDGWRIIPYDPTQKNGR